MKRYLLTTAFYLSLPALALAQSAGATDTAGMANTAPGTSSMSSSAMAGDMTGKSSAQDKTFVRMAAIANMAEVSDGKLAQSKGNAAVQQVGQRMITDHTKANNQLTTIAQSDNIALPTAVDASHAAIHEHLAGLSGSTFDKKYLSTQKTGHEQTIALFQKEISDGTNPQLKSFASDTLPILQQHLQMIDSAMKS